MKIADLENVSRQAAGGKARAAKLSPQRRKEIATIAAMTRWKTSKPTGIKRDWLFVASKRKS